MKSFYAVIAVIAVAVASGAPAAALSPQAPVQSASAPTLVRVDGELKTPTGAPSDPNRVLPAPRAYDTRVAGAV